MDMRITGTAVDLEDVLASRERRCEEQNKMLKTYKAPIISFTLNIVGPIKVFPLAINTFYEGHRLINRKCSAEGIRLLDKKQFTFNTGYEAIISAEADPCRLKRLMAELEECEPIGRLFDIDVLTSDGSKVARSEVGLPERKCLLCPKPAPVCARSRAHRVKDLLEEERRIMSDYFIKKHAKIIATEAVRALLYEVSVTPKPGLVDRNNSGAHKDMDFFTFIDSALALQPYFERLVLEGAWHTELSPKELFAHIRPIGKEAETDMYFATGGVNTHKGAIFSIGIVCCALGRMYVNPEGYSRKRLTETCSEMTADLMKDFFAAGQNVARTSGEKLYWLYGLSGIRGEAASGFPSAFKLLPELERYLEKGLSYNDACAKALISIIASAGDTNIAARSSYERMLELQSELRNMVTLGVLENPDFKEKIVALDRLFISENISPGGSADILSLALFVKFYENYLMEEYESGF